MSKNQASGGLSARGGKLPATAAFAWTIFTGAFLLFLIQPLICKYILPWFGGSSGVWTTCMLFFQMVLFAGYVYAHFSARWLQPRMAAGLHLVLVCAALAMLPITPADSWKPASGGEPTWQILGLLAASIGLPYFVLSATSPLLQGWLNRAMANATPFRLYSLSSIGSLLALLGFPFYLESHFTRSAQARLWGWGFCAYAVGCAVCAGLLWRNAAVQDAAPAASPDGAGAGAGTVWQKTFWLALPACGSVLLLATTNKICQEVAVVPLLWVLPLSLYLLSFVICFDSPRWYGRLPFGVALIAAMGAIFWVLLRASGVPASLQIGIYCAGLFVCCMVCHGELYRLKPDPRYLTGYYVAIAAGGALGSLFVAVVAPLIFDSYVELHWGLFLCGLLFLLLCARNGDARWEGLAPGFFRHPLLSVGSGAGLLALGAALWWQAHRFDDKMVMRTRNFYGAMAVMKAGNWNTLPCLKLVHGWTAHGLQFVDPQLAGRPTLYYTEKSGVGLALGALPEKPRRLGLVGLGVGTLAAYARPGDLVHVYEINPAVVTVATSRFTFLQNCRGTVEVTLGDARLSLEREAPQEFDLLALDAFSDDTIPVHLLTREAFALYQRHLKPGGIIAVHTSSRSVNLEPVLANLARYLGWRMKVIEYGSPSQPWIGRSIWVLLSRSGEILDTPAIRSAARPPRTSPASIPLWTDDYASLFQILEYPSARQ